MDVIPAIDLHGGRVVRLYQGDYAQETVFDDDPLAVARRWADEGASRIHVVDLDGARAGRVAQADIIGRIVQAVSIPIQVGGGVRSLDAIDTLLKAGVRRVILGTVAVENPALVAEACRRFGDAVIVGIDAREGRVAIRGWLEGSIVQAVDLAQQLASAGVARFIHTDIGRDGTLKGPNLEAQRSFAQAVTVPVIASGGVGSLEDIRNLAGIGVEGVLVGKALYTGAVTLPEALEISRR